MSKANNYKNSKVLFVDDEEKAQKYFRKACEADFEVLTASSVDDALTILDGEKHAIGLLVTDQRMPGRTGTDLLQHARTRYPEIVRILTTAYSDLDSAIEAVNSGAIFQYVTKPWNLRELRGVLLRAMDHYQVQRERDALLCEKLSVLQRMLLLDRARVLCALGASLEGRLEDPLHAIRNYLKFVIDLGQSSPPPVSAGWEDMCLSSVTEGETAVEVARQLLASTSTSGFTPVPLSKAIEAGKEHGVELDGQADGQATLTSDAQLLQELVAAMIRLGQELWSEQAVSMSVAGTDPVTFEISCTDGEATSNGELKLLEVARDVQLRPRGPWLDLLRVHLLAAHHAGVVEHHLDGTALTGLTVRLPADCTQVKRQPLAVDWLESLFLPLEG